MKIGSSHRFFCTSYLLAAWLNTWDLNTFTAQKIKDYSVLFHVGLSHSDIGWLSWSKSVLWLLCIHCACIWSLGECGPSEECHVISAVYSFVFRICVSISALLENSESHQLSQTWVYVAEIASLVCKKCKNRGWRISSPYPTHFISLHFCCSASAEFLDPGLYKETCVPLNSGTRCIWLTRSSLICHKF